MRSAVVTVLFLAGCAIADSGEKAKKTDQWKPVFQGVDRLSQTRKQPRPLQAHAVRVHLRTPGIEIITTPSNGKAPGETSGLKTSSFLRGQHCQVAINAAPFSPIHLSEGKAQDVSGLMISRGEIVSPLGKSKMPVLAISIDNKVTIAKSLKSTDGFRCAVSGFHLVLSGGKVLGSDKPLHPRTAAAVSKDGAYLYLLVIDGRQKGFSEGASTKEVGEMLKSLGGWHGINLDGGGTTTMVIEGTDGKPKVLNRPINGGFRGFERVSASHLGVRARRLNN